MDGTKQLVTEAILDNLEIPECSPPWKSTTVVKVADMGCAVGPTTFSQVQNIVDAVELKCRNAVGLLMDSQIPEFQVFFNDQTSNDFNTLFDSLPPNRRYYAAGVPGSFHSRLFPNSSLHIVYSFAALHWLSAMPKEMEDRSSPSWNKGRIYHLNAADEFIEAYSSQHQQDMARFLDARSQEVVEGGLMILFFPGRPDGALPSQFISNVLLYLLGSCLLDMANKGKVSQEKVDSFNLPMYIMSSEELKEAINRNGCFSLLKFESLFDSAESRPRSTAQERALQVRSVMEGLIKEHFGHEILDELFDSYPKKVEQEDSLIQSMKTTLFFAVLRRKTSN